MNRATWCGRVGALCSLVMLVSPSPVPAQELTFGFFDATVTLPTAGTTSYPGWSVGGSMPIAAGGRVSVYGVYNRTAVPLEPYENGPGTPCAGMMGL